MRPPLRVLLFLRFPKKLMFSVYFFSFLVRVQLSIASRIFLALPGAPGALPDAMFDALRAAKTASLHLPIYE